MFPSASVMPLIAHGVTFASCPRYWLGDFQTQKNQTVSFMGSLSLPNMQAPGSGGWELRQGVKRVDESAFSTVYFSTEHSHLPALCPATLPWLTPSTLPGSDRKEQPLTPPPCGICRMEIIGHC